MSNYYNRQWRLPNNENKDKQSNYSMDFDGSQIINVANTSLEVYSLSLWFKSNSATNNSSYNGCLISFDSNTAPNYKGIYLGSFGSYLTNELITIVPSGGTRCGYTDASATIDTNWHHLCIVWDNTNTQYKIYLDSVDVRNANYGTPSIIQTTAIIIGGRLLNGSVNAAFSGKIDGVTIFDYALSSSQVTTLYGSSSTGIGNPMSLNPTPVAYYPLGDQDVFNGSNYLVPNSSLKDYVFSFDGTNDYIDCGNDSTLQIFTGSHSVSAWIYFSSAPSGTDDVYCGYGLVSQIALTSSRTIRYYNLGLTTGTDMHSSTVLNSGSWNHVVCTYEVNGNKNIYINGVAETPTSTSGSITSTSVGFVIGARNNVTPPDRNFDGSISNVQVFNTALSSTDAETLYNNGSPLTSMTGFTSLVGWWKLDASATYNSSTTTWTIPDDSSNSNDGTSSGMNQSALVQSNLSFTNGYSPYALDFDGTNDYINVGSFSLNASAGTVSAWVKTSQSSDFQMIVSKSNGGAGSQLQFRTNADGIFRVILNHSSTVTVIDSATAVNDGNWHNLVFTYSSSGMNLYIDGYLSNSNTTSVTSVDSSTESFMIGARKISAPEKFFNGSISNVSVWNTSLTSTQVSEIYSKGVPQNLNNHSAYSNLVSWWQLGSNSSFNSSLNQWTCIDEKGTNTGESSQTFNENAIVDGVGSYANGVSSGMSDAILGDAPYSSANALSVNMDVLDRTDDTPS